MKNGLQFVLLLLLVCVICCTQIVLGFELFCGSDNCYELLGIERNATNREVKRAYRRLSLELHPDKNNHPDAAAQFAAIATANGILSNEYSRNEYNDFLDHPENYYWYYMKAQYAPKSSVSVVITGLILICTALHWFNAQHNYKNMLKRVKSAPEYAQRVQELIKSGAADSVEEAEQMVQVQGLSAPTWRDSLPVALVKLPFVISKWLFWLLHWLVAYKVLKRDYNQEDKEYLVKQRLRILTESQWLLIEPETRAELVEARVWEEAAWQQFLQQKRIESNRQGKGGFRKARKR